MSANSSPPSRGRQVGFPDRALQARRNHAKHLVAGCVPVDIVDGLEAVEIDIDDGKVALGSPADRQLVIEDLVEQRPVGEAGQHVVTGLVLGRPSALRMLSSALCRPRPLPSGPGKERSPPRRHREPVRRRQLVDRVARSCSRSPRPAQGCSTAGPPCRRRATTAFPSSSSVMPARGMPIATVQFESDDRLKTIRTGIPSTDLVSRKSSATCAIRATMAGAPFVPTNRSIWLGAGHNGAGAVQNGADPVR